jgi:hypothetical protein
MLKIGSKIRIIIDNDSYEEFMNQDLIVIHIAKNEQQHPGYDRTMNGMALVDTKTKDNKSVPFSLYEYEFSEV